MVSGTVHFVLEGLSLEKLLNLCIEKNIRLNQLNRPTVRSLRARVDGEDFPFIQEQAEKRGWKLNILSIGGMPRLMGFAWRRAALVCGVILFFAMAWALSSCVWEVRVEGAGPYVGEVRMVLEEHRIRQGRFRWTVDVEDLRMALERRLTGLAWVSVQLDGTRLTVHCVQGDETQPVRQGGEPGDVVAIRDGIVESLRVTAGTAVVKIGQAVQAGQVLIKGEERSWQGEVNPVRARGEVLARIWHSGEAVIPSTEWITVPDGEITRRQVYCTPWIEISFDEMPLLGDNIESSARALAIGGVWPIWLRIEEYEPVRLEARERDLADLQAEATLAAMRLAQENAGFVIEIVDKWVDYSMIEEGYHARVVLETLEDIASPQD